ncbi:aldehyde dehydrogenase family protein [Flavisolibacter nicotianae]|uniref:aldehyde dehydrogenase family protein n=1 Tax=Flavisolibacter nicotianae TaxID=2364882 RepID=UPI000EAB5AAD|nr:aldehyde dehydrogenase family protein [Flavisolibacter nicotianae]
MKQPKKKIGISFSRTSFRYYWDWFTTDDLGDDLELVELSFEKNNTEDIAACDGFVLTGGIDIHPSFYGGQLAYPHSPGAFEIQRDLFEKKIYDFSQLHLLPLLGICRGLQLVNVLNGGKLIQDFGKNNFIHKKDSEVDKVHAVRIVSGSLLETIAGESLHETNSAHHQAADPDAVGQGLQVNCYSESDGLIEGLEWSDKTNKAFLLCVQWHPERMDNKEAHPLSQRIKERFIQEVKKTNMKKLAVINPATEELITELIEDTKETVAAKFHLLQNGQQVWRQTNVPDRVAILRTFAKLLQQKSEELSLILTSEMGKPLQQARNEINGACTRINWLAGNAEKYLADELMTDENGLQEKIVYEPLGVICNISAWNYPYLVGVNVFVPALLAGNAVLYKPSEYATLTGLQIEKLLMEAGVPADVFQVAIGRGDVGGFLLDLPFDGYFFTGSHKTGQYIYERVAPKMVPCQCELGGKDPLYVADDVDDLNAVAAATADGAFYNNGQSCCAVERLYVHEKIYDAFVDAFVREVKAYKKGLPTDDGVYIGPLSRGEQVAFLREQINDAVSRGALILTGGKPAEGKGYYFEPTVLANVNHGMQVMKDESFGPLIGIMKVASDEDAVRLMNDTDYGLTASVYSSSQQRAEKILAQLNTGTAYWNCCDRVSAALPWSGRKQSGFGSTLSHAGLRAFVRPKAYHLRK